MGFLTAARATPSALLESKHVVAVVPHTAAFDTGEAAVSAQLYVKLPARPVAGGTTFETALTKVVLVGSDEAAGDGLYFPTSCAFADPAMSWLEEAARKVVNGPTVLKPRSSRAFQYQMPFVQMILGEKFSGSVLPVVVGTPSNTLARQVGDVLTKLVQAGGPYENERVLFLFASDLSRNLQKKWAQPRDTTTVEQMTTTGFGDLLAYFGQMHEVADKTQNPPEFRRPYDFAGVLAAVQVASNLGLRGAKVSVGNSGDYVGATDRNELSLVRGYASVVYTRDERSLGEQLSGNPLPAEAPATTTTTTGAPTTVVPPPTMSPVPFGTPQFLQKPSRLQRLARLAGW